MDLLEHAEDCRCGALASRRLLRSIARIDVVKALDPFDPDDFTLIADRLARALSSATEETETEILRKALTNLDVDWPNLSPSGREQVILATKEAMKPIPARILPRVQQEITVRGDRMVDQTRKVAAAKFSSEIGLSMAQRDQRIVDNLQQSQALFVRDEYGRRRNNFSRLARAEVAAGLDQGLGRKEITERLHKRMGTVVGAQRSRNYWEVISSTFMNRSRSFAFLSGMEEAGIQRFTVEAVLDELTSTVCRYMHGRTMEVGKARRTFERVQETGDPESVKDLQPWLREGKDSEGERALFWEDRAGTRTHVAQVERSGVGRRDDTGSFRNSVPTSQLQQMGLETPPYHGRCRTTIVPEV